MENHLNSCEKINNDLDFLLYKYHQYQNPLLNKKIISDKYELDYSTHGYTHKMFFYIIDIEQRNIKNIKLFEQNKNKWNKMFKNKNVDE